MLAVAYDLAPQQWHDIDEYTDELIAKVADVIGVALKQMRPATLTFGHGSADFAANRRLALNPKGPVDHDIPFLKVVDSRAKRWRWSSATPVTTRLSAQSTAALMVITPDTRRRHCRVAIQARSPSL